MSHDNHNPRVSGAAQGNPDIVEAGRATRFAPGRSGNPLGRPSTRVLTEELIKRLASPIAADLANELGLPSDTTFAGAIAARLIRLAAGGYVPAIREVYERIEGKPPKEVVFDDEKDVRVNVKFSHDVLNFSPENRLRTALTAVGSTTKNPEIKRLAEELKSLLNQETTEPSAEESSPNSAGSTSVK